MVLIKKSGGVRFSGIFGSVGLDTRAHLTVGCPLKCSMLVGGLLTGIYLVLEAQVDFVEHGLIPAQVRSEWPPRNLLMWVMRGLGF